MNNLEIPKLVTDVVNAKDFAERFDKDLRYSFARKRWFIWDGKRWALDDSGEVVRKAKAFTSEILARAAAESNHEKRLKLINQAKQLQAEGKLSSMISLARSELPISMDLLDADPWLLNLNNGTLNLRTSELHEHRREDYITKFTAIDYIEGAECNRWHHFLNTVTKNDLSLKKYLQKVVGYALTGDTSEQAFFLMHGEGANGKSTFIEVIKALLGDDYARGVPAETLMVQVNDRIPNDLAMLKGIRFAFAVETEHGKRLAEARLKHLTGGDVIPARFLHGEFFEYKPQFKLFLATNHKPEVQEMTLALWRRIRLIPFDVTIPPEKQDKHLAEQLKQEFPGIRVGPCRVAVSGKPSGI